MTKGIHGLRGSFWSEYYRTSSENEIDQGYYKTSDSTYVGSSIDAIFGRRVEEVAYWRNRVGWRDDDYYGGEIASGEYSNGRSSGNTHNVSAMTIITVIKVTGFAVAATILLVVGIKIRRQFAQSKKNNSLSSKMKFEKKHKISSSGKSSSSVRSKSASSNRSRVVPRSKSPARSRSKSRSRRSRSMGANPMSGPDMGSDYTLMSDNLSRHSGRDTDSIQNVRSSSKKISRSRPKSVPRSRNRSSGRPRDSVSVQSRDSIDPIEKREMLVKLWK